MTELELKRIFQALSCGEKKYYVYALCDENNVPFYIGKGCGERVMQHEADALKALTAPTKDIENKKEFSEKIQKLIEKKDRVQCVIIKWGLSEKEAFMCESALINLLAFARNVKIEALTNIVNGHASEAEKNSVADVATKARTLDQFLQECAIQSRDVNNIRTENGVPKVAFIKINELYRDCLNADGSADNEKIKDVVRAMWRISEWRCRKIEYIFALYQGRVVGVFKVAAAFAGVGKIYAKYNGLPDFPEFPHEARQIDLWKARFSSLTEARRELNDDDYNLFTSTLSAEAQGMRTLDEQLNNTRRRAYFSVSDDVPDELRQFFNHTVINTNNPNFFRYQSPVVFNF